MFFTEIYFWFHNLQLYAPTTRQGGRQGAAAPLRGCRDRYVIKLTFSSQGRPWQEAAARQGVAGPPTNIKAERPPHTLIWCPPDLERGEGERRGEGGSCSGEALPDFGSEPQVTNISQLSRSKIFIYLIL